MNVSLKKLLNHLVKSSIHTMTVSDSRTVAAGERLAKSISFTLPTGANPICAVLGGTPNSGWVFAQVQQVTSTSLQYQYHNEYTGAITGNFTFIILYTM